MWFCCRAERAAGLQPMRFRPGVESPRMGRQWGGVWMEATFWLGLALKMASSAVLVIAACLVVERSGPRLGGLVASLPLSAGPAYAAMAMEHGRAFVATSASGALAALAGTSGFVLAYTTLAQRHGRTASVASALLAWLAAVTLVRWSDPGLWTAAALDLVVIFAVWRLVRPWAIAPAMVKAPPRRSDMAVRAASAMSVVATVVVLGRVLGAAAAGVAALAPVITTSLAILLHPRLGGRGTAAVLASMMPALFGNVVALVVLALTAVPLGSAVSLLLTLAICVAWNLGLAAAPRLRRAAAGRRRARHPAGTRSAIR
jgi:hypothetical protein